jgi:hypothetical protein
MERRRKLTATVSVVHPVSKNNVLLKHNRYSFIQRIKQMMNRRIRHDL